MALTDEDLLEVEGLASRRVRLGGGAIAHYVSSGGDGPAVVLLHGGLPGSSGTAGWRFMAPYLGEHGLRVYCPDMPGYGLADTNPDHWPAGAASHVDFLHEFVTALGLDRFHLAGNSMGSVTTVNYVLAHPERVQSMALIAGDIGDIVPPGRKPAPAINLRGYEGTRESMRSLMEAIVFTGEAISDDLVEMRFRAAERQQEVNARFFPEFLKYPERLDADTAARLSTKGRLDRLTIPGIYLYGMEDVLFPVQWGYEQEDVLPDVQFFYPEQCGHQGQTDRPDLFNPVFAEFFSTGQVSRRSADAAGVSKRRPENSALVAQS